MVVEEVVVEEVDGEGEEEVEEVVEVMEGEVVVEEVVEMDEEGE